ncbi:MAG: NusG domain II-containing protein [Chitinispirillia bacterium]|nr:NusG domain II-containing protein [Chitinispirillia bacterium]MCL2242517.1 NusG domain II-containing protein [Chitinispirillia bacterium]
MRAFGIADALIAGALICGTAAAVPLLSSGQPALVVVYGQNAVIAKYPAGSDAVFTVSGKRGPLDIEIKNGSVRIVHADCPRSICKQSGSISAPPAQLICAPNNILIEIRSASGGNGVDGVAY